MATTLIPPAYVIMALGLLALPATAHGADDATMVTPGPVPRRLILSNDAPEPPAIVSVDTFQAADTSSLATTQGFAMEDHHGGTVAILWRVQHIHDGDPKPPRKLLGKDDVDGFDIHDDGLFVLVEPDAELADIARDRAIANGFLPRRKHLGPVELMIIGDNPAIEARIEAILGTVVAQASATAAATATNAAPAP